MTDFDIMPPPLPDPTRVNQWTAQLHLVIAAAAGAGLIGAGWQAVSDAQLANYVSIILTLASLAGGAYASFKAWRARIAAEKAARAREVDAAVASAHATIAAGVATPVTVAVTTETPPGQPNLGVAQRVGSSETALATTVQNIRAPG